MLSVHTERIIEFARISFNGSASYEIDQINNGANMTLGSTNVDNTRYLASVANLFFASNRSNRGRVWVVDSSQ